MAVDEDFKKKKCPKPGCNGIIRTYACYSRKNIQLLYCAQCEKTFSELTGTPFHDSRLDWVAIGKIFLALMENEGLRSISRSQETSRNTIKRYLKLARADWEGFFATLVEYKVLDLSHKQAFEAAVKKDYSLRDADKPWPKTRRVGYNPSVFHVEEYA